MALNKYCTDLIKPLMIYKIVSAHQQQHQTSFIREVRYWNRSEEQIMYKLLNDSFANYSQYYNRITAKGDGVNKSTQSRTQQILLHENLTLYHQHMQEQTTAKC